MTDRDHASESPATIADLARACVEYVKRNVGVELDGTPDTLPILDHYLNTLTEEAGEEGVKEEVIDLVVRSAGAYFGEVVRSALGHGRWHLDPDGDPTGYRIELEHVFLFFNPLGMVREAIASAEQVGWMAHLEVLPRDRPLLDQSLDRMGDVREDDYYRLAVRFEVIEQVVSGLEGASISRDAQGEVFGTAVYAATAKALRGEGARSPSPQN